MISDNHDSTELGQIDFPTPEAALQLGLGTLGTPDLKNIPNQG